MVIKFLSDVIARSIHCVRAYCIVHVLRADQIKLNLLLQYSATFKNILLLGHTLLLEKPHRRIPINVNIVHGTTLIEIHIKTRF